MCVGRLLNKRDCNVIMVQGLKYKEVDCEGKENRIESLSHSVWWGGQHSVCQPAFSASV